MFLLRRPRTRIVGVALTATMCFVLATGVMTGLGRLKLGIEQAAVSRYQTPAMLVLGMRFCGTRHCGLATRLVARCSCLQYGRNCRYFSSIREFETTHQRDAARADLTSLSGESLDRGLVDPMLEQALVLPIPIIIPVARYLHARGVALGPSPPDLPSSIVSSNWETRSVPRLAGCDFAAEALRSGPTGISRGWLGHQSPDAQAG